MDNIGIIVQMYIFWTPFFVDGRSKFWLPPFEQGGGIWKIKKGDGSMVQGQVLKVEGGWHFSIYFFSRFIIIVEITLPSPKFCYAFEEKFLPP